MNSRILFTCNSKISADEVKFFSLLSSKLQESLLELVFLSPFEYPEMNSFLFKRPGWGGVGKSYNFKCLPTKEAMRLIDVDKWLLRVGYFRGHPGGLKDCLPLLEKVAGESLALLDRFEPGLLVAWNSLYPVPGVMYDIAKALEIPAIDSERGMLPRTLQLDIELRGLHNSLCGIPWDTIGPQEEHLRWQKAGEEFVRSAYIADFCRYEVTENNILDTIKKDRRANQRPKVLVAGAYDNACGISLADPARTEILPGFESGFDIAKKIAHAHEGITIFKPHPEMMGSVRLYDTRSVNGLLLGNGHPRPYLEWADIVVTYGSLEYEAIAFGKPVVLVGRSSLFGKGICYEATSEFTLGAALKQACRREQFEDRQMRFQILVGYLIENQLFRFDTEEQRQRNVQRWCDQFYSMTKLREPKDLLEAIKKEILLRPTLREKGINIMKKFAPSASRRALRIWNEIKS